VLCLSELRVVGRLSLTLGRFIPARPNYNCPMDPAKLFIRDPRELPFLREQAQIILALADESSRSIPIHNDDDFGFMTMQFLCKQIQHGESILSLIPRRDAGLLARTMIDGFYQLLWTSHAPEERAQRWRSFSVIHDWRLIQGRLREGIAVDEATIKENEISLSAFGHLHRLKKPKQGSLEPYHKKWYGSVALSDMADVVGRELYDGPYGELSDWEHWGVSGIGESISRKDGHLLVDSFSERVTGLSLLAMFQCLFQTLQLADAHLSLNLTETLHSLGECFRTTLDSFYKT